jgi:ABC-2 type transport system ATP-binding protein
MIELYQLSKRYGHTLAVDNLSLSIPQGQIFGFVGPNGAGNTTTIRRMMGLLLPTSGHVVLGGHDLHQQPLAAKQLCGFVPDRPHVYEKLTGSELLDFSAGLYRVDEAVRARRHGHLLDLFALEHCKDELIESYSHGMKQRLVMAAALIHRPRILIVDEPMVGLDPRGARLIKEVFRRMSQRGVAILMSTHTLEVAQEMCHRVSIIQRGRIIAQGSVDEVTALGGGEAGEHLTSVFLKLTGGSGLQESDEI